MRASRGFAPLIIVIVITALIGVGAITFIIVKKPGLITREESESTKQQDTKREDADQQKSAPPSMLFGLWREEKRYGYDVDADEWKEMKPPLAEKPLHYDFNENGTTCWIWDIGDGYLCKGDPYTVERNVIRIERPNLKITIGGSQISSTETYQWAVVDGKLELTTTGPFKVKYIAEHVNYPPPKSKAITAPEPVQIKPPPKLTLPPQEKKTYPGTYQEPPSKKIQLWPTSPRNDENIPTFPSSLLGVWITEEYFSYYAKGVADAINPDGTWNEKYWKREFPESGHPYFIEFMPEGRVCELYSVLERYDSCPLALDIGGVFHYDAAEIVGNTATFVQLFSDLPARYRWQSNGEKLEVVRDIFNRITSDESDWVPLTKFILKRVR